MSQLAVPLRRTHRQRTHRVPFFSSSAPRSNPQRVSRVFCPFVSFLLADGQGPAPQALAPPGAPPRDRHVRHRAGTRRFPHSLSPNAPKLLLGCVHVFLPPASDSPLTSVSFFPIDARRKRGETTCRFFLPLLSLPPPPPLSLSLVWLAGRIQRCSFRATRSQPRHGQGRRDLQGPHVSLRRQAEHPDRPADDDAVPQPRSGGEDQVLRGRRARRLQLRGRQGGPRGARLPRPGRLHFDAL